MVQANITANDRLEMRFITSVLLFAARMLNASATNGSSEDGYENLERFLKNDVTVIEEW